MNFNVFNQEMYVSNLGFFLPSDYKKLAEIEFE